MVDRPLSLLGERDYGPPIDLWGAGCIMAEMWTRSPIMQGNTEQHQLTLISQLCGSITTEVGRGPLAGQVGALWALTPSLVLPGVAHRG